MTIESELIEATGFSPRRNYPERQDYLAALARSVDQLADVDFDGLSTEAAEWFNAAARALSTKKTIEDFPDAEEEAPAEEAAPEDDAEAPIEDEELVEPEPEPEPKKKPKPQPDVLSPERLNLTPKGKRSRAGQKKVDPIREVKKDATPPRPKRTTKIEYDKWGLTVGSKNSEAATMFENECRMIDCTNALGGGAFYNMLSRMVREGHKLEKNADGTIKLTFVKQKN